MPPDVQIQCDSCGGVLMIDHAQHTFMATCSGYALNECDDCRNKREARNLIEAEAREKADARRLASFRRWLKKHGMTEAQFAKFLDTQVPREYLGDVDE